MMQRISLALIIINCVYLSCSKAQTDSVRNALHAVESLYNSGSYMSAEVEARRLLEIGTLNDTIRAEVHKYIAFALIAQGKSELAKERFTMLLNLIPAYTLDPIYTSPKILVIFNETKQVYLASRKSSHEIPQLPVSLDRSPISFRTILFPGWEQLHRERMTPGTLFLGAGITTLGAGLLFEILRSSARENYLKANDPSEFNQKYNIYNRYYKAENASFIAFAIVYVASEIDVFATSKDSPFIVQSNLNECLGTTLTLAVKF